MAGRACTRILKLFETLPVLPEHPFVEQLIDSLLVDIARLPRPKICESPDTAHALATEHTQCRAISGAIFVGWARDNAEAATQDRIAERRSVNPWVDTL